MDQKHGSEIWVRNSDHRYERGSGTLALKKNGWQHLKLKDILAVADDIGLEPEAGEKNRSADQ